jgi:hypothetical protein
MLTALPHIKAIEPDQLFYPEAATGVNGCLGDVLHGHHWLTVEASTHRTSMLLILQQQHNAATATSAVLLSVLLSEHSLNLQWRKQLLATAADATAVHAAAAAVIVCGLLLHCCCCVAPVNSVGGKWEVPTGIFRMQAAAYNNRSNELAWVQPNTTNKDVVVAVLDTGIDAGHPDLVDNVVSVHENCACYTLCSTCCSKSEMQTKQQMLQSSSHLTAAALNFVNAGFPNIEESCRQPLRLDSGSLPLPTKSAELRETLLRDAAKSHMCLASSG